MNKVAERVALVNISITINELLAKREVLAINTDGSYCFNNQFETNWLLDI